MLEGDAITQTEEFVPEESIDSEIAALASACNVAAHESQRAADGALSAHDAAAASADELPGDDDEAHATEAAAPAAQAALAPRTGLGEAAALGAELEAGEIVAPARARRAAPTGSPAASSWGCCWLLQAVNHWRDALASSPALGAPLGRLYASIGVPLDPHWNLAAYDIRQQGAASDPNDSHVIRVRLSVANRAPRAQPVPWLRLTLLDRYGKPIAARDLAPAEYWPPGTRRAPSWRTMSASTARSRCATPATTAPASSSTCA